MTEQARSSVDRSQPTGAPSSALRLVGAVAMEIGEEWETNRRYLTWEPD